MSDDLATRYEQERADAVRAVAKAIQSSFIGPPPPMMVGIEERAVDALVGRGWAPNRRITHVGDHDESDGYVYSADGKGVPQALVDSVIAAWAGLDPAGDAARTLRSVDTSVMHQLRNLARVAALDVAVAIDDANGLLPDEEGDDD